MNTDGKLLSVRIRASSVAVYFFAMMLISCSTDERLAQADVIAGTDGFVSLFDGKTLTGWAGDARLWSVEDGSITGRTTAEVTTKENTFLIWRGGELADFELRLKVRIRGNNSGIQYRSADKGNFVVHGYQCDLGTGGPRHYGKLSEEKGRRWLCEAGQRVVIDADGKINVVGKVGDAAAIEKGMQDWQWYDVTVTAKGNHLVHTVNGQVTADTTDNDATHAATRGILAFQIHAGDPIEVQFKDIRLKKL
jgi:hypothetical protein